MKGEIQLETVQSKKSRSLTEGSITGGLISFAIPLLFGQLLQQCYNMADAWVVGNFASNDAFAAVSMAGHITFTVIGFFNGIAIGGGVVISRYFGAKDEEKLRCAIHTNFLLGLISGVISTIIGLYMVPMILGWMKTPDSVMGEALNYFRIYFAGVATVIMYNTCMSIMRALGDSVRPLYYLAISTVINIILDLIFVVGFGWSAAGAAIATVISQGISVLLCMIQMMRGMDNMKIDFKYQKFDMAMMGQVIRQGVPTGIQNCVISIGNLVVQSNINLFGAYAISGHGAYSKIEGLVFLPILSMSMALPTFISQNLGAGEYERAKKGAVIGILSGAVFSEVIGILLYFVCPYLLHIFVNTPEAIEFGTIHGKTVSLFFFMLAITHCGAGALRGCGKAIVPMIVLLSCWCGIRILYVTAALRYFPVFRTISWAYPFTWTLSACILWFILMRLDWKAMKS